MRAEAQPEASHGDAKAGAKAGVRRPEVMSRPGLRQQPVDRGRARLPVLAQQVGELARFRDLSRHMLDRKGDRCDRSVAQVGIFVRAIP